MFNYIRSDQLAKKPVTKKPKPVAPKVPMTPIEKAVNMPIGTQPIPQPDTNTICIYPGANLQPSVPPPTKPLPIPPMPTPCPMDTPIVPPSHNQIPSPSNPSCDMSKTHDEMEVAYIKKMYPPLCQKIQKYVESELNQYDHDLSPIYEMYPSAETITYMANSIYTNMKATMGNLIKEFEGNPCTRSPIGSSFYTLTYVLLLNELYRKRMRRRLYR